MLRSPVSLVLYLLSCGLSMAAGIEVISRSGDASLVFFSGDVELDDGVKFRKATARLGKAVIFLESNGGSVSAGLEVGSIIKDAGWATAVAPDKVCASICGVIWLAGRNRYLSPSSRVLFHAAYTERNGGTSISGSANAKIGAFLNEVGLPIGAIEFVTTAPPSDFLWLTQQWATRLGINFTDPDKIVSPQDSLENSARRLAQDAAIYIETTYQARGVAGISGSVYECFMALNSASTQDDLGRCYILDYMGGRIDTMMSKSYGASGLDFFRPNEQKKRLNSGFSRLRILRDKQDGLVVAWQEAAARAFRGMGR